MLKKHFCFVIMLCAITSFSFAQEFTSSSIKLSTGLGDQAGNKENGIGTVYTLGYQKSFPNHRIRINPNIKIGGYTYLISTANDYQFRSSSLEFNTYYDFIKINSFSLFGGAGILGNLSRGHHFSDSFITIDGENYSIRSNDEFFRTYVGGLLMLGMRIDKPSRRIAYEFIPLVYSFGSNNFSQYHFTFGIDVKF